MVHVSKKLHVLLDHFENVHREGNLHVSHQPFEIVKFSEFDKLLRVVDIELTQFEHAQKEDLYIRDGVWCNELPQQEILVQAFQKRYCFFRDLSRLILVPLYDTFTQRLRNYQPLIVLIFTLIIASFLFLLLCILLLCSYYRRTSAHESQKNVLDPVLGMIYLLLAHNSFQLTQLKRLVGIVELT